MTNHTPTAEQAAIVEFAKTKTANLAVVARAGAAKTFTLVLIAEALPDTRILCLAFNKAIATEMKDRLPDNCESKTLHSLGYGAWSRFTGRRLQVRPKTYAALKDYITNLDAQAEKDHLSELFSETMDMVAKAKQAGYMPDKTPGPWKPLCGEDVFFDSLPMEASASQADAINHILRRSADEALQGIIDFDDMIYCPAICSVSWPSFPLTLIDEAQDLGPINHHILKKLVRKNRIIAVGDPCQAIYAFRGADDNSIDNLINIFSMETLYLTVSFRCGSAIIQNAQWRAPDMRWPEWAETGKVSRPVTWSVSDIKEHDAIICRNNAPLFSIGLTLIQNGQLPEFKGKDLAAPLLKIMEKLGKNSSPTQAALHALNEWKETQLKRARRDGAADTRDKAQCISIILNQTSTLGDAKAYLKHMMNRDGRIHLMTGHGSKGLEYDNVWFLNSDLADLKSGQDKNIKYVIETRAKKTLTYINSAGMLEASGEN